MQVVMDEDVKKVAEFMQGNIPQDRLTAVANGVAELSESLWGHFPTETVASLRLKADPITSR
jgi:hypothetical protein